jgi:hypothetical protein
MKNRSSLSIRVASGIALCAFAANAFAQDLGALKDVAGGNAGLSSLTSGTAGNAAGVIEYCIKNNYLSGDAAAAMKDKLIGKVGGEEKAKEDSGYVEGAKGMLTSGDGKTMNLADAGGLKGKLTEQACKAVLDQAQSLL